MQQPEPSSRKNLALAQTASLLNDYHLLSFDQLDSTNEEAKRIAEGGGTHGAVVWAKKQTAGKGRMGRHWVSDPGNLFVSLLLKPECDEEIISQLSFVAALSAYDTVAGLLPDADDVKLKWPNDILVEDKKIGGILLESFTVGEDPARWVVVGLGLNVEHSPMEALNFPATCLKKQGLEIISAKIVLSRFIHHFIDRYNQWSRKGFTPIRRDWLQAAWALEEEIKVSLPHEELKGVFQGIDKKGALELKIAPRKKRTLQAGDMRRVRAE